MLTQDVLVVASAAFGRNITLYSLDKDDYLNELYISACKNPREQRLCLARAAKKYFAVLPLPTHDILPFLRGPFVDSVYQSTPRSSPPFSTHDHQLNRLSRTASIIPTTTKWLLEEGSIKRVFRIAVICH